MSLLYWLVLLLSRTWELLPTALALWLCWWAVRHREVSRNQRRVRVLLAASILLVLYLPPFGERLQRPELAQYFEPGVVHAEPTFICSEARALSGTGARP